MQETRNKCNVAFRHSCLPVFARRRVVLRFSIRNNCCEFLAFYGVITQSVTQSFELAEYLCVEIYANAFIRFLYMHKKLKKCNFKTFKHFTNLLNTARMTHNNNSVLRCLKHILYFKKNTNTGIRKIIIHIII